VAAKDKTLLEFEIGVSPGNAVKEISRFTKGFTKRMKDAEKETTKLDKGMMKFIRHVQGMRKQDQGVKELTTHYRTLGASIQKDIDVLKDMRKLIKGTTGEERKQAFARIRAFQEAAKTREKIQAQGTGDDPASGTVKAALKDANESAFNMKELHDRAEEAGEALAEPLNEVFRKDAPAMFKRYSSLLAMGLDKTVGKLAGKLQKGVEAGGGALGRHGDRLMAKGGAAKAAGMGLKGLEGISKVLSPILGTFAKLGPILSVASSFMMSFVKIMIDAESAAKDYNKQLLSTTGTSEFLNKGMRNVGAGAEALQESLDSARDGAMAFSNVQWGISKDTAVAFQSALTAEGVSLSKLGDETKIATGYAKDHASVIQMGVAYSRAFGVSLNEISQLQGEMMSDMGASLDSVQASFQDMVKSANQAGIASNKFFGIIRSFSADLTLFTLRMEELTGVMKTLGKTMDPREASKFLHTISSKFSGGLADNLKHTVVAGPEKVRARAQEDLNDRLSGLGDDIASALGRNQPGTKDATQEILDLIKNPKRDPRAIAKWQAKYQTKISGPIMSSLLDAANMQVKLASGNEIDTASIIDQLSPLAKMDVTQDEVKRLTGKGFDQLSGLDLLAVEQAGIASAQEIRAYQKYTQGIITAQEDLIARVESGNVTQDDIAQLAKLNIKYDQSNTADTVAGIREAIQKDPGNKKFVASMNDNQKKLLSDSATEIDYQKETSGFQTSALDKIGIIADILMNQIYNIMTGIWESIGGLTDLISELVHFMTAGAFGRSAKEQAFQKEQIAAAKTKNAGIMAAFAGANGDLTKAKNTAVDTVGAALLKQLPDIVKEFGKVTQELETEKGIMGPGRDNDKIAALEAKKKALAGAVAYSGTTKKSLYSMEGGAHQTFETLNNLEKAVKTAQAAGVGHAAPGTSPAAAVAATHPAVVEAAKEAPTATQQAATVSGIQDVNRTMETSGIKIDKSTITGPLGDTMAKSVYDGASQALFEYYMYSGLDRKSVAASISAGVDPRGIQQMGRYGVDPATALSSLTESAGYKGPAGGYTPAGGNAAVASAGNMNVQLELKGDLKQFIKARVVEGAAEHDRNKRLR
jgi:predicted  nucleic acid-binding Zn-ribbon protein